ncbi:MAG: PilZ domain-containing protein [Deltaproteobacteria bacterium]|nr:PilZ domain-containing protein [Deltaproteobacteria bacterium]
MADLYVIEPIAVEPRRSETRLDVLLPSRRELLRHAHLDAETCSLELPQQALREGVPTLPLKLVVKVIGHDSVFVLEGESVTVVPGGRTRVLVQVTRESLRDFSAMVAFACGRPASWGRRRQLRVPLTEAVEILLEGKLCSARLVDLSRRGAFVICAKGALEPGEQLDVVVPLGWLRQGWCSARVKWNGIKFGQKGMGLEFTELPPQVSQWIQRRVDKPAGT